MFQDVREEQSLQTEGLLVGTREVEVKVLFECECSQLFHDRSSCIFTISSTTFRTSITSYIIGNLDYTSEDVVKLCGKNLTGRILLERARSNKLKAGLSKLVEQHRVSGRSNRLVGTFCGWALKLVGVFWGNVFAEQVIL